MNSDEYIKKFNKSYKIIMSNDSKYIARTSGASIYIHDTITFDQIAVFKDVKHANQIKFSSDSKRLVSKSAERKFVVYDLENMNLINKIYIRKTRQPQDGEFCFSKDNKFIYNTVYTNELLGYISKINIESGETEIIYSPENCVFNGARYISEKDKYVFTGFERGKFRNVEFVVEYDENQSKFKRIDLKHDFNTFIYHGLTKKFIVNSLASKNILFISNNYRKILNKLSPLSLNTTKISFFDVLNSSKKLREKLNQNEEKVKTLKEIYEKNAIEISLDGNIKHFNISNGGKYLAVATTNRIKIYDLATLKLLDQIENQYTCYVSFSPDDTLILVGTWSHGFIYPFDIKGKLHDQ
ncbi:hypothetical protein KHQ81_13250 [Mycoplasmatota bacterium]|nr:hypothetical protein KHQ81_13250 [Mycoplasmatota bacterium]